MSATFGLIPRFPAELGQRKGESRSISAEDLLSEQGSASLLPPVFSSLLHCVDVRISGLKHSIIAYTFTVRKKLQHYPFKPRPLKVYESGAAVPGQRHAP